MTFTVTQPPQLTVSAPNAVALCNGGTATLTATPSGGTAGYTYDWSNDGQENPDNDLASINVTAAGSPYTITVTDSKGCTATAVATVTQPTPIVANAVGGAFTCNMGVATLTVSGGTPGYTFDWSNDGPENPDNDPQNLTGLGAGVYTVTVTDLNGCTKTAQATITITPPTFTPPANTGSTVPCIINAQTPPVPPVITNSCGGPVNITGPVVSANPTCSGTKTYTYTYTDPATGVTATWIYTYTITPPTFTPPAAGGSTVACIANATPPTPPTVNNSCGAAVAITGPVIGPNPVCSGTKTYTYTYTDCTGTATPWVYTYTISPPTISTPTPGSATVACISNAQTVPTPPTVNNSCGTPATMTGPVVGPNPVCQGPKTYTCAICFYLHCKSSHIYFAG
jgi:hypothetical protein